MIMKATCQNVETYVAAQTFYWVGHIGLLYIITIILADMTSLRNRMIIITLNGTPLIASTFAGPRIAELFYNDLNFRWAFGAFTIILVVFCIPVVGIFWRSEMQAKKRDLLPERDHTRSAWESVKHYFVEFDGMLWGVSLVCTLSRLTQAKSCRADPPHGRLDADSPALQPRVICPSRMEERNGYMHASVWRGLFGGLCHMGEVLRYCPAFPVQVTQGPHRYRWLPDIWFDVSLHLVSPPPTLFRVCTDAKFAEKLLGYLLWVLPPGCEFPEHYQLWLYCQQFRSQCSHSLAAHCSVSPDTRPRRMFAIL